MSLTSTRVNGPWALRHPFDHGLAAMNAAGQIDQRVPSCKEKIGCKVFPTSLTVCQGAIRTTHPEGIREGAKAVI